MKLDRQVVVAASGSDDVDLVSLAQKLVRHVEQVSFLSPGGHEFVIDDPDLHGRCDAEFPSDIGLSNENGTVRQPTELVGRLVLILALLHDSYFPGPPAQSMVNGDAMNRELLAGTVLCLLASASVSDDRMRQGRAAEHGGSHTAVPVAALLSHPFSPRQFAPSQGVSLADNKAIFLDALRQLAEDQGLESNRYTEYRVAGAYIGFMDGRAIALEGEHRGLVVVLLGASSRSSPGISAQQLILLARDGRILDKVSCGINSRYGEIATQWIETPTEEGARMIVRFTPRGMNASGWHNYHKLAHGETVRTFREEERDQPSEWDRKGLGRIGIQGDRFVILFPKM
jgi:hypothetical protein